MIVVATELPGPLEVVAIAVAALVVPSTTQAVLVALHETAHAAMARAVGFAVAEMDLGRGPARWVRWCGDALVTVRSLPTHGHVRVLYRGRRWLRTRIAAVALAGPLMNVAMAIGLQLAVAASLAENEFFTLRGIALWSMALTGWVMAIGGIVPALAGARGGVSTDVAFALHIGRATAAELAIGLAANVGMQVRHRFDRAFLEGDATAAAAIVESELARPDHDAAWWGDAALLALARGEAAQALALDERHAASVRTALAAQRAAPGRLPPAQLLELQDGELALAVARAFFLAHVGTESALAEAERLSAAWPSRARSWAPRGARAAALRTRGLVLLRRGAAAAAVPCLRRAVASHEPHWLRALGLGHLALALARLGQGTAARREAGRARRLHPQSLLLPAVLREIDDVLAAAAGASAAAIR